MDPAAVGELVRIATCDVFTTMLSLRLESKAPFANPRPLSESDVTALIGIAGDRQGFVSIHCTQAQARDFTARMLGLEREEVTDPDSVLDAMGEIVNMVAGNVKCGYSASGRLLISLPTVVTGAQVRIKAGAASAVVEFCGCAGTFRVEAILNEPGR